MLLQINVTLIILNVCYRHPPSHVMYAFSIFLAVFE